MRLLFAGTPQAAVPALEALLASEHEVAAVLTRPDTRAGRGRAAQRSEVAQCADAHAVPVMQPRSLREPDVAEMIAALALDAAAIVAYGGLVPASLLDVPTNGWVNLHFSLLPRWRGAAPVQHAIAAGDEAVGACTFRLETGLDTGPIYRMFSMDMPASATAGDLLETLAIRGADLLRETIDDIASGRNEPTAQPSEGITLAPKISVDDVRVRFGDEANVVARKIRAATPAPGAWCVIGGQRVKLGPVEEIYESVPIGELVVTKRAVIVGCAAGAVSLGMVQPPGKRPMPAADFARGARLSSGMLVDEDSL